jgi:hypothetical protein
MHGAEDTGFQSLCCGHIDLRSLSTGHFFNHARLRRGLIRQIAWAVAAGILISIGAMQDRFNHDGLDQARSWGR